MGVGRVDVGKLVTTLRRLAPGLVRPLGLGGGLVERFGFDGSVLARPAALRCSVELAAVDAGGAFGLLVRDRDDAPELVDVRRFHHDWERHASLRLRVGDTDVIDTYQAHDRIHDGDTEAMLDAAYTAWLNDLAAGRSSVMIAATIDTVTDLNTRARLDRIMAGHVAPTGEVRLHDSTDASKGDLVITRRNNRRLVAGRGWVKNGDLWQVTKTHDDGSITVRRASHHRWRASVRLPAWYVAEHVELAYTAHRAPRPGLHHRHRPRHRGTVDDSRNLLRRHDPRPPRQHRLRHPRPTRQRRPPPTTRRRGTDRPVRAVRGAPPHRRRTVSP